MMTNYKRMPPSISSWRAPGLPTTLAFDSLVAELQTWLNRQEHVCRQYQFAAESLLHASVFAMNESTLGSPFPTHCTHVATPFL